MCLREVSRLLKLEHISKQFDDKVVLDDINVEIGSGEIVSPLGPSGGRKTTLLNIILGLTRMDQGKIVFQDQDLSNVPMKKRGLISFFRTMPYSLI